MLGKVKRDPDMNCGAGRTLWNGGLPGLQFAHADWGPPGETHPLLPVFSRNSSVFPLVNVVGFCLFVLFCCFCLVLFWVFLRGFFTSSWKQNIFCPCWCEARGTLWAPQNGECELLRREVKWLYIWWGGAAVNHCWFCSVATEQISLWFPSPAPKTLSLRAISVPSHSRGFSAAPTFCRAPWFACWAAVVRKHSGTGRRAKRGSLRNAMTSVCLAHDLC